MPNPPPSHKEGVTCSSRIVPKFQLCIGWGEEENCKMFLQNALIVRITLHVSTNIIGIYCLLLNKTNKRYNG